MDDFDPFAQRSAIDEHDAWLRATIRRYGWALQAVLAGADSPPFVHTVGLTGFDHPELILFNTEQATAATVLNQLGELVRAGRRLRPGDRIETGPGPVRLLHLPRSDPWMFAANDFYREPGEPPVPALLVVPEDELAVIDGPEMGCRYCN
ncbi:protein of unknown function [Pseudonocardia thermophila]|jgi:hypothetical protein|uniref:DUF4262 domain-containing protein n=1 Tax=Pseudonocardia thermophila TaxID=1848 RepID=A0A1M6VKJ4_PSETH|nr:DUF4262 domain-containing protein [Pseudonocardia thermophila]SHK81989.1 protein of unknown function [Pseudonocardia thermophila]